MMKPRFSTHRNVLAATILALSPTAFAQQGNAGDRIPHQFIVKLHPGHTIEPVLVAHNATLVQPISSTPWFVIESDINLPDDEEEMELGVDDRLDFVEPNRVHRDAEGITQSFFPGANSTDYSSQPAMTQLLIAPAQQHSTGTGIVVAVLDTGVSPTAALAGHVLASGYNFIDDNTDVSDVGNGLDDNGNNLVDEKTGHGTMIAGLIALVAPEAQILPVKVLNSDGSGTTTTVAAGIRYALQQGAQVINMSLICPYESQLVNEAIEDAIDAGVIVVAGMPNNGRRSEVWPAAMHGVLSVAAVDDTDHLAPFSDHDRYVKLCAPGVNVFSTLPDDAYAQGNGTSFATAWVSGAAALVLGRTSLPVDGPTARQLLLDSAISVDSINPTFAGQIGKRLNVLAAVIATCRADLDDGSGTGTPDGGVTIDDLLYFLQAFEQGILAADVDDGSASGTPDGGVTIDDLLYYLSRFATGC